MCDMHVFPSSIHAVWSSDSNRYPNSNKHIKCQILVTYCHSSLRRIPEEVPEMGQRKYKQSWNIALCQEVRTCLMNDKHMSK